ncbi:hypothetical protein [Actinomadura macrotermitis]|uniref:Uncharacterized protein n=1 Tax=Actinomadura macrotermitis TaxID=2585200 RepID=A0A7K0BXK7_9ACTN|nr:hypothetical protein [Actinomadura macrotermitis]MQY05915.1 hypothetical protein [Actinomadura macrotermitis]
MELETALKAAESLLTCCEPIPPVTVTIDAQGERQITVGHGATSEVAVAVELIWTELLQKAAEYRCAAAYLTTEGQSELCLTATVEHAEGQAVEVAVPYRRRRRVFRHKVVLGELVSTERDCRVWG